MVRENISVASDTWARLKMRLVHFAEFPEGSYKLRAYEWGDITNDSGSLLGDIFVGDCSNCRAQGALQAAGALTLHSLALCGSSLCGGCLPFFLFFSFLSFLYLARASGRRS